MRLEFSVHRISALFLAVSLTASAPGLAAGDNTWQSLRLDVFGEMAIAADSPLLEMNAPNRAEDAAMVPIDVAMRLPAGDDRTIEKITLIVDENPAPVAATFRFGTGRQDVMLSTRLRVNAYSFVRAIGETSDGALHMTERFVKASGGCSAPALKDADEALARLGELRLRAVAARRAPSSNTGPTPLSEAQLMIRHPNYSGLQMNQLTRLYTPAKFVNHIVVTQGAELVFEMEGGISLSEDPSIRFNYIPDGKTLQVKVGDTDGRIFDGTLEGEPSPQG